MMEAPGSHVDNFRLVFLTLLALGYLSGPTRPCTSYSYCSVGVPFDRLWGAGQPGEEQAQVSRTLSDNQTHHLGVSPTDSQGTSRVTVNPSADSSQPSRISVSKNSNDSNKQ